MTSQTGQTGARKGGFVDYVGFELLDWSEGFARVALDMKEHHLNIMGVAQGGVALTALDYACGISGCYRVPPQENIVSVTISLSTNFVKPHTRGRMIAEGRVTGGGRSIFFAEGKVLDGDGNLIASGSGAFKRLDRAK